MNPKPHVLVAMDDFSETEMATLSKTMDGWATWERIPSEPPPAEFIEKLSKSDVVIGWPEAEWLLDTPVKLLLLPSAGYEIYLGKGLAAKAGFRLCNARGAHAVGAAEHAVAMMLAFTRRLPRHFQDKADKIFLRQPSYGEITGTTACVVGLGTIGMEIARKCHGLGMVVCGVDTHPEKTSQIITRIWSPNQIQEAMATADHVFCAAPGGLATRGLFKADVFASMKPGAYFYNIARGSQVNERDLIEYLRNGRLAGAGLDVFEEEPLPADNPLWKTDNVIITPHCAGLSVNYAVRFCQLVATNLRNYRDGKSLVNEIALE